MSYHISKADPSDILHLLHIFLKSNVLSWIEVVAETQNFSLLIDAARNFGLYLNSFAAEWSPYYQKMQLIRPWTTYLIRMSAKFERSTNIALGNLLAHSTTLPYGVNDLQNTNPRAETVVDWLLEPHLGRPIVLHELSKRQNKCSLLWNRFLCSGLKHRANITVSCIISQGTVRRPHSILVL